MFFNHANDRSTIEELNKNYHKYFPAMFHFDSKVTDLQKLLNVTETMKRRYFGEDQIIRNYRAFSQVRINNFFNIFNIIFLNFQKIFFFNSSNFLEISLSLYQSFSENFLK